MKNIFIVIIIYKLLINELNSLKDKFIFIIININIRLYYII